MATLALRDDEVKEVFIDLIELLKNRIGKYCLEHSDPKAAERLRVAYQDLELIYRKLTYDCYYGDDVKQVLEMKVGELRSMDKDFFK